VLIVSGFFVPDVGAGETDGPPGAQALGHALAALGIETSYATDAPNRPLFEALELKPLCDADADLLNALQPSHLVSIERVGPAGDGHCYSMRGERLPDVNRAVSDLFEQATARGLTTIGIGDGGNEIGMGLVRDRVALAVPHGERIACVTPADFLIVAGVSNWGACGLAGALSLVAGRDLLLTSEQARSAILAICRAGAVDGRTRRAEPTIDGLPLQTSLDVLESVRGELVFESSRSD
jgi:hypothetical protein